MSVIDTECCSEQNPATLRQQPQWQGTRGHVLTPQYYLSEIASQEETKVFVAHEDFSEALSELSPSVSPAEMQHYARIQDQFASSTIQGKKDRKGKGKAS